jgi:two-component system chemotaxis response regulator CheB
MINIVIVADRARLPIIRKSLDAEKDIVVIHATDRTEGVNAFLNKAQAIVLDVSQERIRPAIFALKSKNVPIIAITGDASQGFTSLEWGAAEMLPRNSTHTPQFFDRLLLGKIQKLSKEGGAMAGRVLKRPGLGQVDKLIVIGSSTGGTDTLEYILRDLPEDMPPILIVQHMPPVFTRMFAERLHNVCRVSVWEAQNGDALARGLVLIAPGNYHMVLSRKGGQLCVKCTSDAQVCNQRPSVDVLFESVAMVLGGETTKAMGVILTGMGRDGARGLLTMRKLGATTIGQNEASCVVYGMPRAAYECGAVQRQFHLKDIAPAILNFVRGANK